MINTFTTEEFIAIVDNNKPLETPLLDLGFGGPTLENTEQLVYLDKLLVDKRRGTVNDAEAPYFAVTQGGYQTQVLTPMYFSEKILVNYKKLLARMPGEAKNVPLSPAEREARLAADAAIQLNSRFLRLLEFVAAEILTKGTVQIPTNANTKVDITFPFPASNITTLTAGNVWTYTNKTVDPWDTIKNIVAKATTTIKTILLGSWAHHALQSSVKLKDSALHNFTLSNSAKKNVELIMEDNSNSLTYLGQFPGSNADVFVLNDTYTVGDTETPFIPQGTVLFLPDKTWGMKVFSPINDSVAGFQPYERYIYESMSEEPRNKQVNMLSSPLLVHTNMKNVFTLNTGLTVAP